VEEEMKKSQISLPLHGGQLRQIAARYGTSPKTLLDFSANINPAGPPLSVLSTIQRTLRNPETLTAYPDLELTELKEIIAACTKVRPENIVVANGFVPLLGATLRSLNIDRCLLPVPCFSEYRSSLESARVAVTPYQLYPDKDFSYDPDSIVQVSLNNECDAILLANPQNPSGVLCESEQMRQLIAMMGQRGITLLLDEAFIDYCPDHSLAKYAVEQPHVVVFRSLTKFFAIPGLRVSYAVCHAAKAKTLNRFIAPWPITTLASHAACAALGDVAYAEESRIRNEQERLWMTQQLSELKIETYRSRTNFLLLKFPTEVDVNLLWERMIVEQQIVLRSCANFESLETGHLRVAIRSKLENERLIEGLERMLK
jgi:threonine-phosphate decarboxylase